MKPNETCRRAPSANIFADELAAQHIAMSGYAVGSFTLDVSEQQGDILVASTTFVNISTTASTTVALNILSGITTMSPLMIDIDGNGIFDASIGSAIPSANDLINLLKGFVNTLNLNKDNLKKLTEKINDLQKSINKKEKDDLRETIQNLQNTVAQYLKKGIITQDQGIEMQQILVQIGNQTSPITKKPSEGRSERD